MCCWEESDQVLGLARKTTGGDDRVFTGEFHPDKEQVAAWQSGPDQSYSGEYRYANKSPTELRRMIEVETDPVEKERMIWTMEQWQKRGRAIDPDAPRPIGAGEPGRGEPREVKVVESVTELARECRPVSHVPGNSSGRE